jgi:hypothetical protein
VLTLIVSALLVCVAVSHASLFWRSEDGRVAELSGTVASVDEVSLRIRPDEGNVMTFVVDDPSSLPTGLSAGARVSVRYETREGGGRRLMSVALAGSSAPAEAGQEGAPLDGSAASPSPDEPRSAAVEPSPHDAAPRVAAAAPQAHQATPARGATGPQAATCPLQGLAVGLLVAT